MQKDSMLSKAAAEAPKEEPRRTVKVTRSQYKKLVGNPQGARTRSRPTLPSFIILHVGLHEAVVRVDSVKADGRLRVQTKEPLSPGLLCSYESSSGKFHYLITSAKENTARLRLLTPEEFTVLDQRPRFEVVGHAGSATVVEQKFYDPPPEKTAAQVARAERKKNRLKGLADHRWANAHKAQAEKRAADLRRSALAAGPGTIGAAIRS